MKLVLATLLALALMASAAEARPPKPRDTTPPTVPTGLRVVAVTEDSITLSWNASTDNSGSIHHYVVAPGSWHPGDSTTKTITGLVPSWTQTYRVSAVDATGNESAFSEPLTATTAPDVTAPTAPSDLRLTASTPSSVSLAWTAARDRWSLTYQVLMDGEVIAVAGWTSARVRHLPPGTHIFTVRARDSAGNLSPVSNAITVTLADTGDRVAPTAPTNLVGRDLADFCGSVQLTWDQSTDNVDPASALEYEIFRDGVLFGLATGVGSAWVYGPDGTSTWTVVAVDRSGNSSAPSNPATVTVMTDPSLC